jgi:hypothetical protein
MQIGRQKNACRQNLILPTSSLSIFNPKTIHLPFYAVHRVKPAIHRLPLAMARRVC